MSGAAEEGELLQVQASDGHRFALRRFAAASTDAPALLFMPAMGTRARFYAGFGAAMAAAGVSVAVADWRGIDSSSVRASRTRNFGYRQLLEDDLPAAVQALRERMPDRALWIGGHSLGGQLGACYAARLPDTVAGLVMIASGNVYFRGWQGMGALRILGLTQAATVIATVLGHFPGRRLGFAGQEARGVIRDWSRVALTGRYRVPGSSFDYEAGMARLRKAVLALGFSGDGLAPARATEFLVGKLKQCAVTLWRWTAADSDGHALDHFSWARQPDCVAPRVAAWILHQHTGARS